MVLLDLMLDAELQKAVLRIQNPGLKGGEQKCLEETELDQGGKALEPGKVVVEAEAGLAV